MEVILSINKCRSTAVDMWRKNWIDAGCQNIDNDDDVEDEDDDGNTSANVTVTKMIACGLLRSREEQLQIYDKSLSDHF
jgi:hypothetical protein